MTSKKINRCLWAHAHPLLMEYHDKEWGIPIHDDQKLFEFLTLEGAQAGLSWLTILQRREGYRTAFAQFHPEKIIKFDNEKLATLMLNPAIIRNRLKIQSVVKNAHAFLETKALHGSFHNYIWQFVDGEPIKNHWKKMEDVPTHTLISDKMSHDLKKRGFTFVGTTICYAFMQAVGMVNDHLVACFKYNK